MVTLKDVAVRAGVSVRTVSNVVNDWPHVRPELRAHVQKVIDELGYRPNITARNLRNGRSGLVALVVPEIDVPYFAELTRCIVDEFSARGLTVVIEQTDGRLERERELLGRGPRSALFDGIVFSPLAMSAGEIESLASTTPLVLLGEQHSGSNGDHVMIDNVAAAQTATQHLVDLGRRRIALVGRQPGSGLNTSALRYEGYKAALRAAGLEIDESLAPPTPRFSRACGAQLTRELMQASPAPDAIFCFNDLLALGALRTLNRAGVRVPEDVAVIGFDDIEEARYATPSLTSIAPDKPAIARETARLLMRRISGEVDQAKAASSGAVEVGYSLRHRESTGGMPEPD